MSLVCSRLIQLGVNLIDERRVNNQQNLFNYAQKQEPPTSRFQLQVKCKLNE